jgi:hypothetical protein
MPPTDEPRRDARHCPTCGAMGILPLDQRRDANGAHPGPTHAVPRVPGGVQGDGDVFHRCGPSTE